VSRDWLLYLDDLIASAEKIERYVAERSASLGAGDEALFDAVLFNLQVIGEAVNRLPADALAQLPEAADARPARLRDLIAHRYFALDPEIIWDAARNHVPELLQQARALRDRSDG
jgi:uncharacterized protein with HEPN domain